MSRRSLLERALSLLSAGTRAADRALDQATLFSSLERAQRAAQSSISSCQTAGVTAAEQRSFLDGASDHARLLLSRGRDIRSAAEQVREALERTRLIALNAGLEGSRLGEPLGRPLVNVADEMRAFVSRGLDALDEHLAVLGEVERERERLREHVEQARQSAGQLADELLRAQSAQREASAALAEFSNELQQTTGTDPAVARAVSDALEHIRGLSAAITSLPSTAQRGRLLRTLAPALRPLVRTLRDLEHAKDDESTS